MVPRRAPPARLRPLLLFAALLVTAGAGCGETTPPPSEPPITTAAEPIPTMSAEDYETACAGIPERERASCSLPRLSEGVSDVAGGVVVRVDKKAGPAKEVERRARCHRAWMAHDPKNAMPRCPLGSPGIAIAAVDGDDYVELALKATKPEDIEEIRRRAHEALERMP